MCIRDSLQSTHDPASFILLLLRAPRSRTRMRPQETPQSVNSRNRSMSSCRLPPCGSRRAGYRPRWHRDCNCFENRATRRMDCAACIRRCQGRFDGESIDLVWRQQCSGNPGHGGYVPVSKRILRSGGVIVALMFGMMAMLASPVTAQDSTPAESSPAADQPVVVAGSEISWTGDWQYDAASSMEQQATFTPDRHARPGSEARVLRCLPG